MSHSLNPGYEPGNHWVVCADCGRDVRANEVKKQWNGHWMCDRCWTPRHVGDLVQSLPSEKPPMEPIQPPPTVVTSGVSLAAQPSIQAGTFTSNNNTLS